MFGQSHVQFTDSPAETKYDEQYKYSGMRKDFLLTPMELVQSCANSDIHNDVAITNFNLC